MKHASWQVCGKVKWSAPRLLYCWEMGSPVIMVEGIEESWFRKRRYAAYVINDLEEV
jgi:hypothetical protein